MLTAELLPFPGRASGSLLDTLAIAIALMLTMTWRVPGFSLALALLFLLQRERPGLTFRSSLQILGGAIAASVFSLLWVQITDGNDVARFIGIAGGIFVAGFCMASTSLPLLFTIFSFYWFLDLSAWDSHRAASLIVSSNLYNLASLSIVMFTAVGVQTIFGTRHPADELKQEMQNRLDVLSKFFRRPAEKEHPSNSPEVRSLQVALVQYAHAGNLRMIELYNRVRDMSADRSLIPAGTQYRIGLLARILESAAQVGLNPKTSETDRAYYAVLGRQCSQLLKEPNEPDDAIMNTAPARIRDLHLELTRYFSTNGASIENAGPIPASGIHAARLRGLFLPDAFKESGAVLYSLKLTLAAMICYILYNALDWPGIITCVVTVLFTGLSSTGAMKQKQLYRISGAVIGGAMGIAAVAFLFPDMDSITSLVLVVGVVSFLSAWVLRSPHMGYVGVQIGFAFFLTALPGFTAATLIAPARDRVIGIGLGILVSWLVFDQLWPLRTSGALMLTLKHIREATEELHLSTSSMPHKRAAQTHAHLRIAVSLELANMQALHTAAFFDFGRDRRRELARSRSLVRQIEAAAAEFYDELLLTTRSEAA
jgi:multidrug resistance protein MdtO